jgi:hypothetical protein
MFKIMNEPPRLKWFHSKKHELDCGVSSSESLPPIWQQQGEEVSLLTSITMFGCRLVRHMNT